MQAIHDMVREAQAISYELFTALLDGWRVTPPLELRDKVAIVTGGSRGLGLLIAEELGAHGARVAICGRDAAAVETAKRQLEKHGIDVLALRCDVGSRREAERFVDQVVETFGRLDIVVNNAGVIRVGALENESVESIEEVMKTNFWGAVHVTFRALPKLRLQGNAGRVVNVTSVGGRVPLPHMLGYNASKFGLMGFSESLRAELDAMRSAPRVVTVIPGLMRTGSFENAEFEGKTEEEFAWFALSSASPLLTTDPRDAAERIVSALRAGRPFLELGLSAHVADLAHRISPTLVTKAVALAGRLLPKGGSRDTKPAKGREVASPVRTRSTMLRARSMSEANNEQPPTLQATLGSDDG